MSTEEFFATVKYNDFTGTAAADSSDSHSPEALLRGRGLLQEGERVFGISFWDGENFHGVHQDPVAIEFLVSGHGYDSMNSEIRSSQAAVSVRRQMVEMPIAEFLGLFKRFSLTLSRGGMLEGREIEVDARS
jgi:hypothetical protein